MSELFPTFERLGLPVWRLPSWLSSPWWPADTLASKQRALLRVLSVAISERLELAPLVTCFANEHRGRYRRRLIRLARRLTEGTALPNALDQTPGTLSDEQMLAVRFGIQSGTLSETLRLMVEQQNHPSNQVGHRVRQVGFYMAIVGALFLLILSFLMIKIIPSFNLILEDFSLEHPKMLILLIRISNSLVQYWLPITLFALLCVWLVKSETSHRLFRRQILSRLIRPVVQLRSANLLNLLAMAQQSGRPLPGALSSLARYHYDSSIRQKLLFVRNEVEQGADIWKSMMRAHLISPAESRALASPAPIDCQVWTMRRLAEWKRNRVANSFDTYVDFLQPIVVLLMAAIVLFTALATLTPLMNMINGLSG